MKSFDITITRLVTERFRIVAATEDAAWEELASGEESEFMEKIEESTIHASSILNGVEELTAEVK